MERTKTTGSVAEQIAALNSTPISKHLSSLLASENGVPDRSDLTILSVMAWAAENHYQDSFLAQLELAAVSAASSRAPGAVYSCLADHRMLEASSLDEAAEVLVSRLSDIFDDRSLPKHDACR